MPKCFSALCLFAAWLCASGAALHGVQFYAWGRMVVAYAREMPVIEAVAEAVDGSKPCALCLALRHVREESQHEQPAATSDTCAAKVVLITEEPTALVFNRGR